MLVLAKLESLVLTHPTTHSLDVIIYKTTRSLYEKRNIAAKHGNISSFCFSVM